jgi:hypothetical protein
MFGPSASATVLGVGERVDVQVAFAAVAEQRGREAVLLADFLEAPDELRQLPGRYGAVLDPARRLQVTLDAA